jgi:hypothetical protein
VSTTPPKYLLIADHWPSSDKAKRHFFHPGLLLFLITLCLSLGLSANAQTGCTFSLNTNYWEVPPEGGVMNVDVITDPPCAWSVTWPQYLNQGSVYINNWLTISTNHGVGAGSIILHVLPNAGCTPRNKTITVAGHPFLVSQGGGTPTYNLPTKLWTARGNGDHTNVSFSAGSGCAWSVDNPSDWLTISPSNSAMYSSYSGLELTARRNTNNAPRVAVIGIADQQLVVYQPVQDPMPGWIAVNPEASMMSRHKVNLSWAEMEPGAPRAEWYHLRISSLAWKTNDIDLWLQGTNWQAPTSFAPQFYTCQVQGWNSGGLSRWDSKDFYASDNLPLAPDLRAPQKQTQTTPRFYYSWIPDFYATWYELCVVKGNKIFADQWFPASAFETNCEKALCDHSTGQYTWWVRGWNPDGMGPWSTAASFSVALSTPGQVSGISPQLQVYPMTQTNFIWSEDPAADWYCLWVNRNGSTYFSQWVHGTNACTPTNLFTAGNYSWWVRPWNAAGFGPWSSETTFTVPRAGTPVSPVGVVKMKMTLSGIPWYSVGFEWFTDETTMLYELYINRNFPSTNVLFFHDWIPVETMEKRPAGKVFTYLPPDPGFGTYTWWVRGWSPVTGMGPWSDATSFTIESTGFFNKEIPYPGYGFLIAHD